MTPLQMAMVVCDGRERRRADGAAAVVEGDRHRRARGEARPRAPEPGDERGHRRRADRDDDGRRQRGHRRRRGAGRGPGRRQDREPPRSTSRAASTRPGSSASRRPTTRRSRSRRRSSAPAARAAPSRRRSRSRCWRCCWRTARGWRMTASGERPDGDAAQGHDRRRALQDRAQDRLRRHGGRLAGRDTELDRKVAIKMLHDRFAQDDEFVERFRREAAVGRRPAAPERRQHLRPRRVRRHVLHRDGVRGRPAAQAAGQGRDGDPGRDRLHPADPRTPPASPTARASSTAT